MLNEAKDPSAIYDLIIVGGGPIGLACALEAEKQNLRYTILEKGTIVNSLYHYPLYMRFFSTADKLEIGNIPFLTTAPKPGRQDALEYYQGICRTHGINIKLYEKAEDIVRKEEGFIIRTEKAQYQSKYVILATGFYDTPNSLGIPGEALPKVSHYYTEPYPYSGTKVVVIGASNSAADAALETWRKGAEVTMIIRGNEIGKSVKYWVKPDIENRIQNEEITAHFGAEVTEILPGHIRFRTASGEIKEIENDFVLAMTGYLPDFSLISRCGIACDPISKIPVYNEHSMETNVPDLYLAGVVCGGLDTHLWFIENSRIHAQKILADIFSKENCRPTD